MAYCGKLKLESSQVLNSFVSSACWMHNISNKSSGLGPYSSLKMIGVSKFQWSENCLKSRLKAKLQVCLQDTFRKTETAFEVRQNWLYPDQRQMVYHSYLCKAWHGQSLAFRKCWTIPYLECWNLREAESVVPAPKGCYCNAMCCLPKANLPPWNHMSMPAALVQLKMLEEAQVVHWLAWNKLLYSVLPPLIFWKRLLHWDTFGGVHKWGYP